jgi:MYXO-CTERM domain-containing protein
VYAHYSLQTACTLVTDGTEVQCERDPPSTFVLTSPVLCMNVHGRLIARLLTPLLTLGVVAVVVGGSSDALAQVECGVEYRVIDSIDPGTAPDCLQLSAGATSTIVRGQQLEITNTCDEAFLIFCTPDFGVSSDCGLRVTVEPGASASLAVGDFTRDLIADGSADHRIQIQWRSELQECEQGCSTGRAPGSGWWVYALAGVAVWRRRRKNTA